MDDSQDKPDYFQFRWGVKEWDVGFTTVPNPVLKHYSRVAWVDKDGKKGRGISNQEMLCIIHIASFHYESEQGEARPAIGTVARRMGYRKDDSVRGLIKSLEHKNLLLVERPPGKCNIYSLTSFSKAILEMDSRPPHPNGDHPNGGLSEGGHSSGPHSQGDEEKKVLEEGKQEGKEEKEKKEGFSPFPEPPAPAPEARSDGGQKSPVVSGKTIKVRLQREKAEPRVVAPDEDDQAIIDSIIEQAETHPGPCDLGLVSERAQAKDGNYAAPPPAGGDDRAAEAALVAMYAALDGEPPREGTGAWKSEIAIFGQIFRDRGVTDLGMAEEAGRRFGKANRETPHFANPYLGTFAASFGLILGRVKKSWREKEDRRVRAVARNEEALAAFDERMTARPPPVEDCPLGAAIKGEIRLQMTKPTYQTYVEPAAFTCGDDVLTVTAPDAFTKDWLENRLADTVRRTAVGVVGRAVEVLYEAAE